MSCVDGHCVTCADELTLVHVRAIDERRELALCETAAGGRRTVETALVAPVAIGDALLEQAGTAIAHAPETAG